MRFVLGGSHSKRNRSPQLLGFAETRRTGSSLEIPLPREAAYTGHGDRRAAPACKRNPLSENSPWPHDSETKRLQLVRTKTISYGRDGTRWNRKSKARARNGNRFPASICRALTETQRSRKSHQLVIAHSLLQTKNLDWLPSAAHTPPSLSQVMTFAATRVCMDRPLQRSITTKTKWVYTMFHSPVFAMVSVCWIPTQKNVD
jgi:hypothetical protein